MTTPADDDPYTPAAHAWYTTSDHKIFSWSIAEMANSPAFRAAVDAAVAWGRQQERAELDATLAADGFVAVRTDEWRDYERWRAGGELVTLYAVDNGQPDLDRRALWRMAGEDCPFPGVHNVQRQAWYGPVQPITAGDDHDA